MKEFEKSKVGIYDFIAMPFHCDFNNHLRIDHLGNDMLNAADFHSDTRGFGMNYLNTINKTWVLSRFAIEIVEMPKSYEKIQVETWVESAVRFFTKRNFAVKDNNGKYLAYGKSIWAMIDTETRQPTDLLAIHDGLLKE
ncbi:MAG: acyl-[Prevotella sp.]|nr:acyl-[acyl-carrier-protein] thioesterase [Prevotella sp.]